MVDAAKASADTAAAVPAPSMLPLSDPLPLSLPDPPSMLPLSDPLPLSLPDPLSMPGGGGGGEGVGDSGVVVDDKNSRLIC
jgi:hypothetical protein